MMTLILGKSWSYNKVRIKTKSIYKHATFFIYFNVPYQPHVENNYFLHQFTIKMDNYFLQQITIKIEKMRKQFTKTKLETHATS
jgi:hypothetical protein